jgi:hypothetical protein
MTPQASQEPQNHEGKGTIRVLQLYPRGATRWY